jgi:hypothetical protein
MASPKLLVTSLSETRAGRFLSSSVALALVTILGTTSATVHGRAWNARTLAFLLMAFLIAGGMAAFTFYYHVHENNNDGEGDANVAAVILNGPTELRI